MINHILIKGQTGQFHFRIVKEILYESMNNMRIFNDQNENELIQPC